MHERVAFFGGTFDPVHLGHMLVAQDALEGLGLDKVVFIPAGQNPLKRKAPEASEAHRVAMLRLAIEGHPHFSIWEGELERQGPSYTIETVEALRKEYQGETYWIIGEDQVGQLPQWHRAEELARMTQFACLARPGTQPQGAPSGFRVEYVAGHPFAVSSTEIRERAAAGRPIDFLVPQAVRDYIETNKLYQKT